uniref:Putative secreted protein n=1 Tax=Anopheles darlingi TaxID=43151 RepID=A0A2M4D7S1_ANODA
MLFRCEKLFMAVRIITFITSLSEGAMVYKVRAVVARVAYWYTVGRSLRTSFTVCCTIWPMVAYGSSFNVWKRLKNSPYLRYSGSLSQKASILSTYSKPSSNKAISSGLSSRTVVLIVSITVRNSCSALVRS